MELTFEQLLIIIVAIAVTLVVTVKIVADAYESARTANRGITPSDFLLALQNNAPQFDNKYTQEGVEALYNSLPENMKQGFRTALSIASPLTDITSFPQDNEFLAWVKNHTVELEKKDPSA